MKMKKFLAALTPMISFAVGEPGRSVLGTGGKSISITFLLLQFNLLIALEI